MYHACAYKTCSLFFVGGGRGGRGRGRSNHDKSIISTHLSTLSRYLRHYSSSYDNIALFGGFNSEYREDAMHEFCCLLSFASLIKDHTCFKSVENPSFVELILTNMPKSFQNYMVIETGLSDFHKLTVTVLKSSFRKKPHMVIEIIKTFLIQNFAMSLDIF